MSQTRDHEEKFEKLLLIIIEYYEKHGYGDLARFGDFALPRDDAIEFIKYLEHFGVEFQGYARIRIDRCGQYHEQLDDMELKEYFDGTEQQLIDLALLNISGGLKSDVYLIDFDRGTLDFEDFGWCPWDRPHVDDLPKWFPSDFKRKLDQKK